MNLIRLGPRKYRDQETDTFYDFGSDVEPDQAAQKIDRFIALKLKEMPPEDVYGRSWFVPNMKRPSEF